MRGLTSVIPGVSRSLTLLRSRWCWKDKYSGGEGRNYPALTREDVEIRIQREVTHAPDVQTRLGILKDENIIARANGNQISHHLAGSFRTSTFQFFRF